MLFYYSAPRTLFNVTNLPSSSQAFCSISRRCYSQILRENDAVLFRNPRDASDTPHFQFLRKGGSLETHKGVIKHEDVFGKRVRTLVSTNRGKRYRVHHATLAEYIVHSKRQVTPIYPSDANLITSVLDIHPPLPPPYSPTSAAPEATEDPVSSTPIRVLEAGTGHGSLTLYLARAVAACNTAPPFVPPLHWDLPPHKPNSSTTSEIPVASEEAQRQRFSDWLDTRTAHLHTIEVNSAVSALARRNIHAFHRGTYYPHITFHTSPLDAFLASSLSAHSQNAFLTHAVLDLPDSHLHLEQLSKALHPDAVLVVFTPSISQVMKAVEVVRRTKVGLVLDSVMELSSGKGGREWDVRATQTRAKQRAKMERQRTAAGTLPESTASKAERDTSDAEEAAVSSSEQPDSPAREEDDYEMVCRPKVGMRVVGGGFLSVWRRTRDDDDQAPSEMPLNE